MTTQQLSLDFDAVKEPPEEWRAIPGYEGYYDASSLGRIRSVDRMVEHYCGGMRRWRGRVLKPNFSDGRSCVSLSKENVVKRVQVGSLVLLAFVGASPDGWECCHFDGDPSNDALENLRWDTHAANMQDAVRHLRIVGETRHNHVLTDVLVAEMRRLYSAGQHTMREIAEMYDFEHITVKAAISAINWKHVQEPYVRSGSRAPRGERNGRAKLTPELVREIRGRIAAGESHRAIAKQLGVGKSTVAAAANGTSWGHVK